jgi:hypothetical protein
MRYSPDTSGTPKWENCLRLLCARFWGKAEEGRRQLFKSGSCSIPRRSAVDTPDEMDVDRAETFKYLELEPDLRNFLPDGFLKLLVREEYVALLRHIEGVQETNYRRGAVAVGHPGIGKVAESLVFVLMFIYP